LSEIYKIKFLSCKGSAEPSGVEFLSVWKARPQCNVVSFALQCFLGSNIIIIFQQISKPFIATAIIGLKINIRLHCKINRGVIRGVIVK
jgi:hypothetical protein